MVHGTKQPFGIVCADGRGFPLETAMNKMTGYPKVFGVFIQNLQFERIPSNCLKNPELIYDKKSAYVAKKAKVQLFSVPSSQKLIDFHKELKDLIIKQKYEQIMLP